MEKRTWIIASLCILGILILISINIETNKDKNNDSNLIGGQTDEHNCLIAAGYQYCSSTGKCQRMWEEYCSEFKEQFKVINFEKCKQAGGVLFKTSPDQCVYKKIIYIEDVSSELSKTYCLSEQRQTDICTAVYEPVCGYSVQEAIQPKPIPSAQTYSNSCVACADSKVIYYKDGECGF